MDWKLLFVAFGLTFLSELGDKSQLLTMTLVAESDRLWVVFIGASAALLLATLLSVAFGDVLTRLVPPHIMRVAAGLAFIVMGGALLVGRL